MLKLINGLLGLGDVREVHRARSDYLLVLLRFVARLLARLQASHLPIVDGNGTRVCIICADLPELLLVLPALVAHDHVERAAELCRVGRACLNLLGPHNSVMLLA